MTTPDLADGPPGGRSCTLTGIGGQGVQLAGQVLARAAVQDGRHVQLFQSYGGMMRGGQTEATVVVDDAPVLAPPVLGTTWSALVMHAEHWAPVRARLDPQGVVLVNRSVVGDAGLDGFAGTLVELPATDVAVDLGDVLLASMVLLGAYGAVTGLASAASLALGLEQALPSYRQERAAAGIAALQAGATLEGLPEAPAWRVAVSGS